MQFDSKKIITGLIAGLLLLFIIIIFVNKEKKDDDILVSEDQKIEENIDQTNEITNNQDEIEEKDNESIDTEEISKEEDKKIINNTAPVPANVKPAEEKPIYEKDSKEDIEQRLNEAKEKDDYQSFADALGVMYEKGFDSDENLVKIESEMYVKGTGYFESGEIGKALEMADVIFSKAFSSWRFKYLKIRCLEKYGRDEFEKGDYDKAEEYAMKILQIEFRPEGANLLGDVYIKKIEANLATGDKEAAQNNLDTIWDYEVDQVRRDRLNELKTEIESL
ncbi:MAG: hypothetical protein ABIC96_00635 [Patescibacteria group bacterium]